MSDTNPHRPALESLQTWSDVAAILEHADMLDFHPASEWHLRRIVDGLDDHPLTPWPGTALIGSDMLTIERTLAGAGPYTFYIVIRDDWGDKEKSYQKVYAHRTMRPTRRGLSTLACAQIACARRLSHWYSVGAMVSCKATPWR